MSRPALVMAFGASHLVLSLALTIVAFAWGMDRFTTGAPPTIAERGIEVSGQVLRFPVVSGIESSGIRLPGLTGYLPFLLNSGLWAIAAFCLIRPAALPRPDDGREPAEG